MTTNLVLVNEFKSNKNKATLWNFMHENNIFKGIDNKYSNEVKIYFEEKINQFSTTILPTDSLVTLNKQVISEIIKNNLKYTQAQQTQAQAQSYVTSGDITEQRQKKFNQVLEKKQSEFNNLMNNTVPDKIDFSDNPDKPIGSEMEKMLADTIAWREKQLNVVLETQNQKEASNWINRDQLTPTATNVAKHIKIGQSTDLDATNIVDLKNNINTINTINTINEKKVSFNLNQNQIQNNDSQDNFLNMLKHKNDNDVDNEKNIENILKEILNNQQIIINLLTNTPLEKN